MSGIYTNPYFEGFSAPQLERQAACNNCPILDQYLILLSNATFKEQLEGSIAEHLMTASDTTPEELRERGTLIKNAAQKISSCLRTAEVLQENCAGVIKTKASNGEVSMQITACGSPAREEWAIDPNLTTITNVDQ